MTRSLASIFMGITLLSVPLRARADAAQPASDAARALREAAADAFTKGDYATCREKAGEALKVGKEPQTVGLLGMCEAGDHNWLGAAEHLDYAMQFDPSAQRKAQYQPKLAEAKTHVGSIVVNTTPDAAELHLDDKDEGGAPKTLFVSPGHYVIRVEKEHFEPQRVEVDVTAGNERPVSVKLEPGEGGAESKHGKKPVWPAVLLASVGAVGLGVGVGLEVVASGKLTPVDGVKCPGAASTCPQKLQEAVSAHNSLDAGGIASFSIGGAALVGMIGYLIWPGPSASAEKAAASVPIVVPVVAPNVQGFVFSSRF